MKVRNLSRVFGKVCIEGMFNTSKAVLTGFVA